MGLLLQIVFIGLISAITLLALYTLLIFMVNLIQKKKDSAEYFNNIGNKGVSFSDTANESAN
jgi:hypothetical protein